MNNGYSMLMADDDEEDKLLMQHACKEISLSAELDFVSDGVELLEYLQKKVQAGKLPSIILLDLNMPRMGGTEVLKKIKEDKELKKIPVIIYSTSSLDSDIEHSYNVGASSYIVKPNEYSRLILLAKSINKYWFESVNLPQICAQ